MDLGPKFIWSKDVNKSPNYFGYQMDRFNATSWNNVSARAKKMSESPYLDCLRRAGWKILIHGWKKNDKTNRYELKVLDLS